MRLLRLLTAILVILTTTTAHAWNNTGHRVIASIAFRQLDDQSKQKIAEVLRKHPAYADLWAHRPTNGPDAVLNLFWNASVFPDDARSEPWRRYGQSPAHYVNYRIPGDQGSKVEPLVQGENILNSYVAHLKQIENPRTSVEDKALHLSWVFHQAGDIHQPLHAVARFSKVLPQGDRGGNEVTFPRGDHTINLHAYWDGLLGMHDAPAAIEKLADELVKEYPREGFADDLKKTDIKDWAEESVQIALKTVYHDLDPEITEFTDIPVGYEADAKRAARRRVALAGYRLAGELKRLFGDAAPLVSGDEPSIVFDNRPEFGMPLEAERQQREQGVKPGTIPFESDFQTLTKNTIKRVRIRYFDKSIWKTEAQAREYVAGLLTQKAHAHSFPLWSEVLGEPQIECVVEFTDEHRHKLLEEHKPCREGRLLLWQTESCFRDATGRWWFVTLFDYFHKFHPKGDRFKPQPK